MLRDILRIIGVGLAVILGLGFALRAAQDDDNNGGGSSTPYEAACDMLNDGDTRQEAFDVLVGLDVTELAASRAVNEAANNGCG